MQKIKQLCESCSGSGKIKGAGLFARAINCSQCTGVGYTIIVLPEVQEIQHEALTNLYPSLGTSAIASYESLTPTSAIEDLVVPSDVSEKIPLDGSLALSPQSNDGKMQGTIKRWHHTDYGFIKADDGGPDVYVRKGIFRNYLPEVGTVVEFYCINTPDGKRSAATNKMNIVKYTEKIELSHCSPSQYLRNWSFTVTRDFKQSNGQVIASCLPRLAALALKETWTFGDSAESDLSILENYFIYTFYKIWRESKIAYSRDERLATFNTGLVNEVYKPIYALYEKGNRPRPQWKFKDFLIQGVGSGKILNSFSSLPAAATYFDSPEDLYLRPDWAISIDYVHVILDGIKKGRFPYSFLAQHWPEEIPLYNPHLIPDKFKKKQAFAELASAIGKDTQKLNSINHRLEAAKDLARARASWNYKTAIPNYFPTEDKMSLLLPLALVDDERVDIALVVEDPRTAQERAEDRSKRAPAHRTYTGHTILTLDMAYKN